MILPLGKSFQLLCKARSILVSTIRWKFAFAQKLWIQSFHSVISDCNKYQWFEVRAMTNYGLFCSTMLAVWDWTISVVLRHYVVCIRYFLYMIGEDYALRYIMISGGSSRNNGGFTLHQLPALWLWHKVPKLPILWSHVLWSMLNSASPEAPA